MDVNPPTAGRTAPQANVIIKVIAELFAAQKSLNLAVTSIIPLSETVAVKVIGAQAAFVSGGAEQTAVKASPPKGRTAFPAKACQSDP